MCKFVSQIVLSIVLVSFATVGSVEAQEFNELTLIQLEKQLNAILKILFKSSYPIIFSNNEILSVSTLK